MTLPELLPVVLTMAAIFAALVAARMARQRFSLPKPPLGRLYLAYNGIVLGLLAVLYAAGVTVPGLVPPVLVVGGNGVLAELFGVPRLPARAKRPKEKKGAAAQDPNREKIVPGSKKKRAKKKR